ncbi:MAG: acetyl-CoA carboxylase biotin carboxyl carrier protein [Oscillatoriaceae bacterium SKW80]|nr:acetyl-CoA carboxylase biotin carboxyl carrier protein [Oscillatoriaceae bacterium SKYG93]MCX8120836.1 acetyl-CoA carboxylase biotin carboxyl carrier protein [Oscillatoriaceae bacterium SKW80]MDW8454177.1 acetyl-CoA carboxylase biotin carboxyl carrier protein [Oscillatoriaceae cyanobacterium SKYGB_i_bin93]HIK26498.1 acetyl-CoA carboxylase biotin carboxyl carrier protein [Oscillatoriaceae cyanobacterium M7585_C2015_266]
MQLDLKEIRELLAAIDRTDISELTLKSGDFELTVRKATGAASDSSGTAIASRLPSVSPAPASQNLPIPSPDVSIPTPEQTARGQAQSPACVLPLEKKWVDIISPMVGTFYRAPAPDEPPFVSVGERITVGQTVCIIEAMKLMNEIESEVSGQVMEITVQNGQPVEYGQVLMRINPD